MDRVPLTAALIGVVMGAARLGEYTAPGPSNDTCMGLLSWPGLGTSVGYVAAQRRGFPLATGVVAGLMLGPLAVVLFVVPFWVSHSVPLKEHPCCPGRFPSDARVCQHCGALLEKGWGSRSWRP